MEKLPASISYAIDYLESHFGEIFTVKEWASGMGYAPNTFWRKFRQHYKIRPNEVLLELKKRKLIELIISKPELDNTGIAFEFGLTDGNGLYQFVKKHFKCTPSELKNRVKAEYSEVTEKKRDGSLFELITNNVADLTRQEKSKNL